MKHLFIFIILLSIFSNCENQPQISKSAIRELPPFVRMNDTILISVNLDTLFRPIGLTIFVAETNYYLAYSNGLDSLYFQGYWLNEQPSDKDTIGLRASIQKTLSRPDRVKNIDILTTENRLEVYYEENEKQHKFLNFSIAEKENGISIDIIYQTDSIDQFKIQKFKDLCKSVKFKVLKKINK